LATVASGPSPACKEIVQRGGIDLFIGLLVENESRVVYQAILGIGNLAVDNISYRDEILQKGGIDALMKIVNKAINHTKNTTIAINSVWAITNLCRGNLLPSEQLIKNACQLCGLLCNTIKLGVLESNQ
jgi:hypothetical protein